MKIVRDVPPLYREIVAAFPVARRPGVIFSWGDTIYNPSGGTIDEALMAHESVHGARQIADVVGWWHRYIDEPAFRFAEELLAHQAEYQVRVRLAASRQQRRGCLKMVAARLAAPLYGRMVTTEQAKRLIADHVSADTSPAGA